MAQGQRNGNGNGEQPVSLINISPDDWAKAAVAAGYTVHNGLPVIGVSGESGDGYLVSIAVPTSIDPANLARALLSHALRVGQSGVKASKSPDRTVATDAANGALNGNYKPQRERDNDIVEREAKRMFEAHVSGLVKAAKADATDDDIAATVKAQSETDAGKNWIDAKKAEILAAGTYTVARKASGKAAAVAITL